MTTMSNYGSSSTVSRPSCNRRGTRPPPCGRLGILKVTSHCEDHGHVATWTFCGARSCDACVDLWASIGMTKGYAVACAEARARRPQTVTASNKIGRNDPCACGSGLKAKKCCGTEGKNRG